MIKDADTDAVALLLDRSDRFLKPYIFRIIKKYGLTAASAFCGNLGANLIAFSLMMITEQKGNTDKMFDLLVDKIEERYDQLQDQKEQMQSRFYAETNTCKPLH